MKFSKKALDGVKATGQRQIFFDEMMTGLAIRVSEVGRISFYFVYRQGRGRGAEKKWLFIGKHPQMTPEVARLKVRELTGQVAGGTDPVLDAQKARDVQTVAGILEVFFAEHVRAKLKSATIDQYERISKLYVTPAFGKVDIDKVIHRDVARLHHSMRDKPYMANRCYALLSKFFGWCEANGYRDRGTNPVVGLEKYKEEKKMDFLDAQEMGAIGTALSALEAGGKINPLAAAGLRMLLLTGMRLMELLSLKWDYLDLEAGTATLPQSKTGFKVVPLPAPAVEILKGRPNISEYVFTSPDAASGHMMSLRKPWKLVCETAELSGRWRVHDLRHGFASAMVNSGVSLPIIGKVLGHKRAETTARYAHIGKSPAQQAAEEAAAKIVETWKQKPSKGIIPFQPKRAEGE